MIQHPYIEHVEDAGRKTAVIKGTRVTVREVLECYRSTLTTQEFEAKYPDLPLSSIYDAVGYADDNREEIERELEACRPSCSNAVPTEHPYIEHAKGRCGGDAVIKGTRIAVWIIVQDHRGGLTPEQILANFPHLTLSRIFDALGYAADHRAEIEANLEANKPPPGVEI